MSDWALEAAERRLRREEAAEAPLRLWCRVGARLRGSAGRPVECGHPAARGSCGHGELCAENEAPCTPPAGDLLACLWFVSSQP